MVSANLMMLHMDKDIWGDPENFRPERFLRNGELDLSLDKSLPFGAGMTLLLFLQWHQYDSIALCGKRRLATITEKKNLFELT